MIIHEADHVNIDAVIVLISPMYTSLAIRSAAPVSVYLVITARGNIECHIPVNSMQVLPLRRRLFGVVVQELCS